MKPTLGRIVHFYVQDAPIEPDAIPPMVCCTALIIGAIDDRHVDLQVFRPGREPFQMLNMPYSPGPCVRTWTWPTRE
jgi:hypothetical protein